MAAFRKSALAVSCGHDHHNGIGPTEPDARQIQSGKLQELGRVIDPPKTGALYVVLPQHSHMSEIYSQHR